MKKKKLKAKIAELETKLFNREQWELLRDKSTEPEIPWSTLPDSVQWVAKDKNDDICGHYLEPKIFKDFWITHGNAERLNIDIPGDWKESLRKRPEEITDDMEYQKKLLKKLQDDPSEYESASLYTVILDLIEGSSFEEVHRVLTEVRHDLENESLRQRTGLKNSALPDIKLGNCIENKFTVDTEELRSCLTDEALNDMDDLSRNQSEHIHKAIAPQKPEPKEGEWWKAKNDIGGYSVLYRIKTGWGFHTGSNGHDCPDNPKLICRMVEDKRSQRDERIKQLMEENGELKERVESTFFANLKMSKEIDHWVNKSLQFERQLGRSIKLVEGTRRRMQLMLNFFFAKQAEPEKINKAKAAIVKLKAYENQTRNLVKPLKS